MALLPQSFINDLVSHINIVDIIEKRIALKKNGSRYLAKCPFHQEKTPSFHVDIIKQFYYCFGCQAHGNVISFLMAYDRLTFLEAIDNLAAIAGMSVPRDESPTAKAQFEKIQSLYPLMNKVALVYQKALKKAPHALEYLKSRGLSSEMVSQFGIGFAPDSWDFLTGKLKHRPDLKAKLVETGMLNKKPNGQYYDRFRNRIMFPIKNRKGDVIAFGGRTLGDDAAKYLNSPENPIFHKGQELYALHLIRKPEQLLVAEGYMDVIVLHQYGIDFAVASLGTAITQKQIQLLIRTTSSITFCFDGDTAGKKAAWRSLEIVLPLMQDGLNIRFLFLPQGEDPDSFIQKKGQAAFKKMMKEALSLPDFFFEKLKGNLDLNSISGKATFSKAAKSYLNNMPEGIYKSLMLEKTADFVGVPVTQLIEPQEASYTPSFQKRAKPTNKVATPMRIAISLLIQYPNLAKQVSERDFLNYCSLPGHDVLKQLFRLLEQYPDLTTGGILENFRDQIKVYQQLKQLLTHFDLIPEKGVKEEFSGALVQIQKQSIAHMIQALLEKARKDELTADEKQKLQKLITMQKKVEINS